jgi:hypothetical protein
LDKIFKFNGVVKSPMDVTGQRGLHNNLEVNRSYRINAFIEENNIKEYVIIDDMDLSFYVDPLRFIRTNEREGLKQLGAKRKILEILDRNE